MATGFFLQTTYVACTKQKLRFIATSYQPAYLWMPSATWSGLNTVTCAGLGQKGEGAGVAGWLLESKPSSWRMFLIPATSCSGIIWWLTWSNGLGVGAGVGGMEEALEPPCSALTLVNPAASWSGFTFWKVKQDVADNAPPAPAPALLKVAVLGVWAGVAGQRGDRSELVELVRLRTDLPPGSILTSSSTK